MMTQYDMKAIMTDAWKLVRGGNSAKFSLRDRLSRALRNAWREAKYDVQEANWMARTPPPATPAALVRAETKLRDILTRYGTGVRPGFLSADVFFLETEINELKSGLETIK